MSEEAIKKHLTAIDLHDNGCMAFLFKHCRFPEYLGWKKAYAWRTMEQTSWHKQDGICYLPHFLTRAMEIKEQYFPGTYWNETINNGVLSGEYVMYFKDHYEAFAEACRAWGRMKPVHRLFLSCVPSIHDVYN